MRECLLIFRQHKPGEATRTVLKKSKGYCVAAEKWEQKVIKCARCGKLLGEWKDSEHITDFDKISMPSSMMDKFRKDGWIEW